MIVLKSKHELGLMREAGKIVAEAHEAIRRAVRPGVSTGKLNDIAEEVILKHGATASFKGYNGFPSAICASPNEVVVHGFPSYDRILLEGEIISVDIGAHYKGYHGDSAKTHAVGAVSEDVELLIRETRASFYKGLEQAVIGNRISDISHAVQEYAESFGLSVIRDFVGHGIGRDLHEDPPVPNYGRAGRGPRLDEGMVIAVEPMIALGTYKVKILDDGWTTVTLDGKYAAHYEHTIAITADGPELLTLL